MDNNKKIENNEKEVEVNKESNKKSNKKIIYISTAILVVLLIAAVLLFFMNKKNEGNVIDNNNQTENQENNQENVENVDNNVSNNNQVINNSKKLIDKKVGSIIWFSGKEWIYLDKTQNGIKLLAKNNIATLGYMNGNENSNYYPGSYLRNWLNTKFYNSLKNKDYIVKSKYIWKNEGNNEEQYVLDNVGLATTNECIKRFNQVDIQKFFYTLSASEFLNDEVYCISDQKTIESINGKEKIGIRPVIVLKKDIEVKQGEGTQNKPYYINNLPTVENEKLNTRYSGEYLKYSDTLWRIVDINPDLSVKILRVGIGDDIVAFDKNALPIFMPNRDGNIGKYLNEIVYDRLKNKEWIIEGNWYIKDLGYVKPPKMTEEEKKKYKPKNRKKKQEELEMIELKRIDYVKAKIGLLKIGDLFTGADNGYNWWLLTQPNFETDKVYSVYSKIGKLSKADAIITNQARIVLNLKSSIIIAGGNGTKLNPYLISDIPVITNNVEVME